MSISTSLAISKFNIGKDKPNFIDLEKYRQYINNNPGYEWKENLDDYYVEVQHKRRIGIIKDKIPPRDKMDFYFNYNKNSETFDLEGTYFDWQGYIHVDFQNRETESALIEIFNLAESVDAYVYKGSTKLNRDYIIKIKNKPKKDADEIVLHLKKLNRDFNSFIKVYAEGNNIQETTFLQKLFHRNSFKILSWDYLIKSATNVQTIVQHNTIEGMPKKGTLLEQHFPKNYANIFEYYIGEIIIRKVENARWQYFEEDDEKVLSVINKNNNAIIFPGTLVLSLLASEGKYDLVEGIKIEIQKLASL